jgi:hypothetical protein
MARDKEMTPCESNMSNYYKNLVAVHENDIFPRIF